MGSHEELKKELMGDWRFRLRWYWSCPKYWLIGLLIKMLNKLSGLDKEE